MGFAGRDRLRFCDSEGLQGGFGVGEIVVALSPTMRTSIYRPFGLTHFGMHAFGASTIGRIERLIFRFKNSGSVNAMFLRSLFAFPFFFE